MQLAGSGDIDAVFSLCVWGAEGSGAIMVGDVRPATFNVQLLYTLISQSQRFLHCYLARSQNVGAPSCL